MANDGSSRLSGFGNVANRMDRVGRSFGAGSGSRAATGGQNSGAGAFDLAEFDQALGQYDNSVCVANQSIDNVTGAGADRRCRGLREQGIQPGAEAQARTQTVARVSDGQGGVDSQSNDWRVSLAVPSDIMGGPVLSPFAQTGGKLIFPFNPTILFGNSANYSQVHPTHTNYHYNAYQHSQVDQITINGEFFNESLADCKYWIAVIHYLRTMTKMFYGEGPLSGNPPLITRLNGYGKHVLNNIPVVISNFTTDLPNDVDYIGVEIDGELNYVPTQSLITVTVLPQYSRRIQSQFSLKDFAAGKFVKSGTQGFV